MPQASAFGHTAPAHALRHLAHWPARLPHSVTAPATSLWHNLAVSALRYPNKPATLFFGSTLTYAALHKQAEVLAAWLHAQGVGAGDRVLLLMQNSPQWVVAHFAVLRANAVVVPVNPMNRAQELEHSISDPEAKCAIVAADLCGGLMHANASLPSHQRLQSVLVTHYTDAIDGAGAAPQSDWLRAQGIPDAWLAWLAQRHGPAQWANGGELPILADWADALASAHPLPPHVAGPADLAVLPYTSGTTGLPKGCMHTHASVMHNAFAANLWVSGTPDNVMLAVVPMFHITGMVSGMHACVVGGGCMVIMPRWERELAGSLISRHRVTHWTNVPTMVIDLMASPNFATFDLSSLVYIGGGGAAMPQAVAQRLWEQYGLRYAEGYGLTETAAPSHANPPDATKQQCLGMPILNTDARVVDPDTLQEVPAGQAGEIVVHGPQVFAGYWRKPEATQAAFFMLDGKSFFRTGDLGWVDSDGYYFLTDRLKRMINASGFKVWPAEVEAMMYRHPAVAEACVIAAPDAYRGETVKAMVVLRSEHRGHQTEADMLAWCRDNMAAYKSPKVLEFVDALPKSGSGKVMWRQLQEAQRTQPTGMSVAT